MQINNTLTNVQNNKNKHNPNFKGQGLRGLFSTLANTNSLATTVCLEGGVSSGRSINAYKRGGFPEMRERLTDDLLAAVFWMKGVDIFNKIADKVVGKKLLHLETTEFDVGKDILRTPFENLVAAQGEGMSAEAKDKLQKTLSRYKFTKVFASTLLAVGFVGFVLPKINQGITKMMMSKKKKGQAANNAYNPLKENTIESFTKTIQEKSKEKAKPTFGNGLTTAAFLLENNAICKMMSSDVGIISGRMLTARNKDEAIEYGFRDSSSSFFYYASTPILYALFQKLTGSKNATSIDPVAAKQLSENVKNLLGGEKMAVGDFAKKTMGEMADGAKEFLGKLKFNYVKPSDTTIGVITLKDFVAGLTDDVVAKLGASKEDIIAKAKEMAKLQPEQAVKGAVLTKQQVADVLKNGSINTAEFMQKTFGTKFGDALTNPNKFIPIKQITKFRSNMDDYIQAIIKSA